MIMAVKTLIEKVQALANGGPDCGSCAGPLKVIVRRKMWINILVYKLKSESKIKMVHFFYNIYLILTNQ
jgi:hypothetical protein